MIKKIQKYLLLHTPILWNIRIIPLLFILIGLHILFFGISYLSTDTTFSKTYYYYSPMNDLSLLYFLGVITSVLLLIGWLVFYNRNNGFKTFYPRKSSQLYLEWFLILVITTGLAFTPYSITKGYEIKWKSVASLDETNEALKTIQKVKLLIPNSDDEFRYNSDKDSPIPIPKNMKLTPSSLDLSLYDLYYNSKGALEINGYRGPSLLFYKSSSTDDYYSTQLKENAWDRQLKKWLIEGQNDSILSVMLDFKKLQKKHNLQSSLTAQNWFKRVYNPPFFPANESSFIARFKPYYDDDYNTYLPIEEVEAGYNYIQKIHYQEEEDLDLLIIVSLCVSMCISLLIFSFRVTDRKPWLIALIASGVLFFVILLLGVTLSETTDSRGEIILLFICLSWLVLFGILLGKIISKIRTTENKGKSPIYLNILIWLIPCVIPLATAVVVNYSDLAGNYISVNDEFVMNLLWIDLVVMIPTMWFVSMLVRKWKSVADE